MSASPRVTRGLTAARLGLDSATSGLWWLFKRFRQQDPRWAALATAGLLGLVGTSAAQLATPWIVGKLIDSGVRGSKSGLRISGIELCFLACATAIVGAVKFIGFKRLADVFKTFLTLDLLKHLHQLPLADLEGSQATNLKALFIDDVPIIASVCEPFAARMLTAVIQGSMATAVLSYRYSHVVWIVLLAVPLNVVIGIWHLPSLKRNAENHLNRKANVDAAVLESTEAAPELKARGSLGG